jgi:hypothetical protein
VSLTRESLESDIPAGKGKTTNLFYIAVLPVFRIRNVISTDPDLDWDAAIYRNADPDPGFASTSKENLNICSIVKIFFFSVL